MAGTDLSKGDVRADGVDTAPAIILIAPQLGQNIGAAARAMLNCGLSDLRLVAPRDGWPNPSARSAAAGADIVIDRARVFATTAEAVADLSCLLATTARPRDMVKDVLTPRAAAARARAEIAGGQRVGLLFGPERTGLDNDDIVLSDAIVTVPLNPGFTSLNLGQAVLLLGYEWYTAGDDTPAERFETGGAVPATKEQVQGLFDHLEAEMVASGFFDRIEEKRPALMRNVKNFLQRRPVFEQDVQTWRGIVKALAHGRWRRDRRAHKAAERAAAERAAQEFRADVAVGDLAQANALEGRATGPGRRVKEPEGRGEG